MPSAVHIVSHLHEWYSQVKAAVMQHLKDADYVVLTSDIWTSLAGQSYISTTAYFTSPNWELNICMLQTLYFPESHTGVLIFEKNKRNAF